MSSEEHKVNLCSTDGSDGPTGSTHNESPGLEINPQPVHENGENEGDKKTNPVEKTTEIANGTDASSFRASRFAEKITLSWWFPQILDDENNNLRIWMSRRSRALVLQTALIGIILIANLALTIFAVARYSSKNGVGLIYEGNCDTVNRLDVWIHLLINLLSTGMLSASNYCMQLQAAPTRANVDAAHARGKRLVIGVSSARNLWHIGKWRRVSWLLLALSSVPIHLIYNSAVFPSLSSNDYTIAVVKDSFLDRSPWSVSTAEKNRAGDISWDESRVNPTHINGALANYTQVIMQMQEDAINMPYQRLDISECFKLYDDYWAPQGNALIFVGNESLQTPEGDSLLMYVSIIPRSDDWAKNMWALGNGTGHFTVTQPPQPVTYWLLGPPHYNVSHCLVQPLDAEISAARCRFEYSPQIMFTVCLLNFIKPGVMFCIWILRRWQDRERRDADKEVLYTLGDAIASFMRRPDETTRDMGLVTKWEFLSRRTLKTRLVKQPPQPSAGPRPFTLETYRWWQGASHRRWFLLLFVCCLVIALAGGLLGLAIGSLKHRHISTSIRGFWEMGFGALTPYTYLVIGLPRMDPGGLIANVLLANLPQLILSILYIFYNAMLSTFLVQREFSRMHNRRKPLRVSEPIGIQRSSYFISLPLRYGIPLYGTSGIMHWLISQSLFLTRITAVFPDGSIDVPNSFSTCGYSPIAIFMTLLVGLTLVVAIVCIGFALMTRQCQCCPRIVGLSVQLATPWKKIARVDIYCMCSGASWK